MNDGRLHLDILDIDDPCTEDWGAMRGDDVSRFCKLCHQNVYNLSAMDRADAERFVAESEGSVCVRFYRRADGTVVTRDCGPDRIAAARRAAKKGLAFSGLAMAGVLGAVGALGFTSLHVAGSWVEEIARKIETQNEPEPMPLMGAMPEHYDPPVVEDPPITVEPLDDAE